MAVRDIGFEDGPKLYIAGTAVWFLVVGIATLLLLLVGNAWV